MRIIARRTLREFWERHERTKQPLRAWYSEASKAEWKSPWKIKQKYRHASFIADNRVVFNNAGNRYWLITHINFNDQIVYVKFVGTHAEYDQIDAESI